MRVDGKEIARVILEQLKQKVSELKASPHLVVILVGNDPASAAYVRQKELKANLIGIQATVHRLPQNVSQTELLMTIKQFNDDSGVHGLIVQRPLPKAIDEALIDAAVSPEKDIDSFRDDSPYDMPLALAVFKILEKVFKESEGTQETNASPSVSSVSYDSFITWLKTKNIVVMGKGQTGGGPTIALLQKKGINPTVVDSKTTNPSEITKTADILICAVGKSNVVNAEMIKPGAILLAVGMHRGEDEKLHGDYEEEDIKDIASYYTPIPGGVGPVNVAMLLQNLVSSAQKIQVAG